MRILFNSTSIEKVRTGLLIIPVAAETSKKSASGAKKKKGAGGEWARFEQGAKPWLKKADALSQNFLSQQAKNGDFTPQPGKRLEIASPLRDARIKNFRLSSISSSSSISDDILNEWRRLGGDAARSAKRLNTAELAVLVAHLKKDIFEQAAAAIVEGAILANYEFTKFKGTGAKKAEKKPIGKLSLTFLADARISQAAKQSIAESSVIAESACFARDLVNTPPSDLLPVALVKHAREIVKKRRGLSVKIYDKSALGKLKAFALLGVSRGSSSDPYLIHLRYLPRKRTKKTKVVTLIGKGITFDSGGLSLKTGKGMEDMKCDMAGAACVLSVIRAMSLLPSASQLEHEVHVLIPTAENMVSGPSVKPGDVLRAMNGKTIEVLNTDAEGRLILADALCFSQRIPSDYIVDLATLTGACVVALGSEYAGLFVNNSDFEKLLQRAFGTAGEKVWPLPLASEYRGEMESQIADLRNIGTGGPGAILGALFLKEFVPANVPWAHLDIAGPAFVTKGNEYIHRGGTGFGVRSLLNLLRAL